MSRRMVTPRRCSRRDEQLSLQREASRRSSTRVETALRTQHEPAPQITSPRISRRSGPTRRIPMSSHQSIYFRAPRCQ